MEKVMKEKMGIKFKRLLAEYQNIVDVPILEKCNRIVDVGGLTITLDKENKPCVGNLDYPTQFTEDVAEEIYLAFSKKTKNVKIYKVKDWYREQIQILKEILESLENEKKVKGILQKEI